ncbi:hypothetical protein [Kordia sp.]|uniref:hypothetical protein n=1 Tax=Kordia sp. TaxID=1965332 RepID=UPI003D6B5404
MRNQTKSLNKLLLSKVRVAKVSEQQMILGAHNRSKRGTNSKTGNSNQNGIGQIQVQFQDAFVYM